MGLWMSKNLFAPPSWIIGEAPKCFECWHFILMLNNWIVGRSLGARVIMFSLDANKGNLLSRWIIKIFLKGRYISPQQLLSQEQVKKIQKDAKSAYLKIRSPRELLRLKYKGLEVGPQVYDDVLKYRHKTISDINPEIQKSVEKAFLVRAASLQMLRDYKIVAGVITHTTCSLDGVLLRSILQYGKPVYQLFGGTRAIFKLDGWKSKTRIDVPVHHRPPEILLRRRDQDFPLLLQEADKYMTSRLEGKAGDFDSIRGFSKDKRRLEREFFSGLPEELKKLPRAFVFLHCMPDDPHVFCGRRFQDYYDWFKKSLEAAQANSRVLWIFKDHPSKKIYQYQPDLKKEIEQCCKSNIIYLDSERFSNQGLEKLANITFTHSGTAALEYAALGIPGAIADISAYSGLGLVGEFESASDFLKFIKLFPRRKLQIGCLEKTKVAFFLCAHYINYKLSQGILSPRGNMDIRQGTKTWILGQIWGFVCRPHIWREHFYYLRELRRLIQEHLHSGKTELVLEINGRFRVCPID